jgi:hypothetical protein
MSEYRTLLQRLNWDAGHVVVACWDLWLVMQIEGWHLLMTLLRRTTWDKQFAAWIDRQEAWFDVWLGPWIDSID